MRFLLILVLCIAAVGNATAEPRIALVIGNSAYEHASPLPNPINDARLIGKKLKGVGFDVEIVENANLAKMEDAVYRFSDRLRAAGPDAVGLFYFAGHGLQRRGRNYLVPIDAKIRRAGHLLNRTIGTNLVLDEMAAARNRLNIIILDACRDNPFPMRSLNRGLAPIKPTRMGDIYIAFATAANDVASDGDAENSPFSGSLAKHIDTPGMNLARIFEKVTTDVLNATEDTQRPWLHISKRQPFYPAKEKIGDPPPPPRDSRNNCNIPNPKISCLWRETRR